MSTHRVLVVDDIADAANILVLHLRAAGYEATAVTDPREAVAAAVAFNPHAVLLDIGMPHINGYELAPLLLAALAANRPYIIALTAWGSEKDRAMSKAAGFDEHLVKPLHPDKLEAALSQLLARRSEAS